MAAQDTPLTVRFEALGRETSNIEQWSIDSSYLVSTDGFSFTYADGKRENLRGLECQPVQLIVRDAPQLVGRIDVTERTNALAVSCEGRDYMADLVESHIDPLFAPTEGMTLQKAVALAASPCGITLVLGDAAVMRNARTGVRGGKTAPGDFLTLSLQDMKPDEGQGIYEYINRLAARHGCTVQPTLNRNELLLQAPHYDQDPLYTIRRSIAPGGSNRIKSATARRDFSSFPTFTVVRGAGITAASQEKGAKNASGLIESGGYTPETLAVSVKGRVKPSPNPTDATGKLYRLLSIHDSHATKREQVNAAAQRAIWDRLKETLTYRATLKGHEDPDTKAIYAVDTVINVQDEVADVNETMWIYRRTLRYSRDGGAETDIECWRIGAYQTGNSS